MSRKTVSAIMLFLLVISTLTLAFKIQSVKADDGTVYVNADGSISPISGNVVTNVTSFEAIRWQEKTFFAAGRYWLFYVDGGYPTESSLPSSTMYYTTSTDGVSWTPPTALASGLSENSGENVQAFLSNSGYLQVFYRINNELFYRMGSPNSDGSITWATPSWQLVFNANAAEGEASGTCDFFAIVDSNNYPWVSWGYVQEPIQLLNPSDTKMYVWKDAFNNGTWQTASGFPYNVGTGNYTNDLMIPLSNGQNYVMYFLDNPPLSGQIYGELWNGTAWGPQETCTTSQVNEQYVWGQESWDRTAVADSNDNIYLAFLSTTLNLVFVERTMSGGWTSETIVQGGCGIYSSPSFNLYDDNLRLFWINSSTSICYKKYVGGVWDTDPTLIVNETNSQIAVGTSVDGTDDGRLNAFTMSLDGSIGLLWVNNQTVTNTGQIMFGLQPQTALTFSNIGLSSTVANSTCTFSCCWTDTQGLGAFIFSTNNTGNWQNDSTVSLSGTVAWTNVTKTLNPIVGTVVGYEWFANDTNGNWASTGIQTLTTHAPAGYISTEPIYIQADGSIQPSTAPISSVDNVTYTLTNDITANVTASSSAIIIQRDNITIDGAGHTLQDSGASDSEGIDLTGRSNVTIKNMQITAFYYGIDLNSSSNNSVSGNNITSNSWAGIWLDSSSDNNSVSGNSFVNCGLLVFDSYGNVVTDNLVNGKPLVYLEDVSDYAVGDAGQVILVNCNNVTVENLNLYNTNTGVELWETNNTTISDNDITANTNDGISFYSSANNNVSGNNVTNDGAGVDFDSSSANNSVSGNNITNDGYGIMLFSSANNSVSGNNITNNGYGIMLFSSDNDNSVSGNNITNNSWAGIYLLSSANNSVSGNNITNNGYGMMLFSSANNGVSGNNITRNSWAGVYIDYSDNNSVSGNNITNNRVGIEIDSSSKNTVYHNNFINNTGQVYSSGSTSVWDVGYPICGNYWSDYNGTDLYSGQYQNVTGSDGIGDTPYVIDANNTDFYPLMGGFSDFNVVQGVDVQVVSNSTVSDFQFNGTAILFNVSGTNGTTGFCNVCIPTALLNGTLSVFVNGTQVQYRPLARLKQQYQLPVLHLRPLSRTGHNNARVS